MIRPLIILLVFICLRYSHGYTQEISGKWIGNFSQNIFSNTPVQLTMELKVYKDSLVTGSALLDYGSGKYEHYRLNGVFHKADSILIIREDSTIGVRLGLGEVNCPGTYRLKLSVRNTYLHFGGKWRDNPGDFNICPSSSVWLEQPIRKKKAKPPEPIPPPTTAKDSVVKNDNITKDTVGVKDTAISSIVKPPVRKTKKEGIIEIPEADKDSIKVEIVDNADIDNDIVSVYKNDKPVLSRLRLTHTPSVFYISLEKGIPMQLKMVAESVGSVPPCTAHMTITTKSNTYHLDLSSSMSITSSIELVLK